MCIYLSTGDHLDSNLTFEGAVQDLYATDPAQETCAIIDRANCTGPTRQYELDHTDEAT